MIALRNLVKFIGDWEVLTTYLATEAVNTSETSANFYETTHRNIPQDSHIFVSVSINGFIKMDAEGKFRNSGLSTPQ
jgi:hypothetical protein